MNGTDTIVLPELVKRIVVPVFIIAIVVGVVGNVIVILACLTVKRLHTYHNVFIISLAVVDTVIVGYLLPHNIASLCIQEDIITGTHCVINGIIAHVCFTTSVHTIMIIAVNRYVRICCTLKYYVLFSRKNVSIILIYSYAIGVVFAIPLIASNPSQFIYDDTLQMCIFDRYGDWTYTTVYQTLCLALPICVTILCYVCIFRKVHKTMKKQMVRHWNNKLRARKMLEEISTTKTQFAVFICYMLLYTPFGITATFIINRNDVSTTVHMVGIYLCYLNSSINSVIYGVFNTNIREAYKEVLSFKKPKCKVRDIQSTTSSSRKLAFITPASNPPAGTTGTSHKLDFDTPVCNTPAGTSSMSLARVNEEDTEITKMIFYPLKPPSTCTGEEVLTLMDMQNSRNNVRDFSKEIPNVVVETPV